MHPSKVVVFCLFILFSTSTFSQLTSASIKSFVSDNDRIGETGILLSAQSKDFYAKRNYEAVWVHNASLQKQLLHLLQLATYKGLNTKDYYFNYMQ